jgi:CRISPR/Cas system CMR-associated protein Cmr3 (group 5 of RAMP superfamily)
MAIQDEMYKMIVQEIDETISLGMEKRIVDVEKAKLVAKMLSELSMDVRDADTLVNQYVAGIKNICR